MIFWNYINWQVHDLSLADWVGIGKGEQKNNFCAMENDRSLPNRKRPFIC